MSPLKTKSGIVLVLSAPSGAGKTSLARKLVATTASAAFSISCTTRAPRGRERDGVDYHFIDSKTFQERLERGEFLEWAQVHDHFYGTPVSSVEPALQSHSVVVLDIDVQGGSAVKAKMPEAVLVFILPPSMQELERRLRERGTDTEDTIVRRLLVARSEMERGVQAYDYLIVNDDLERAFEELRAIVTAERCRRARVELTGFKL